jgi:aspartyl aminopeptidase
MRSEQEKVSALLAKSRDAKKKIKSGEYAHRKYQSQSAGQNSPSRVGISINASHTTSPFVSLRQSTENTHSASIDPALFS